jgi:LacI family transcriptional regulator
MPDRRPRAASGLERTPVDGTSRRRVALLIETSNAYARGLLHGIIAFVRDHPGWIVDFPEISRGELATDFLQRWRGDGIIARIETQPIATALARRKRIAIVDTSAGRFLPNVPWVESDDLAVATLAFDHFNQRSFQQLAYCGDDRFHWSRLRQQAFQQIAATKRVPIATWNLPARLSPAAAQRRLIQWLQGLPRPIGILACYDLMGRWLLETCREASLAVPGEVAVLGVDDDHFICNLTTPSLSSVQLDAPRTGYLAATLLDAQMDGKPIPTLGHYIAPLGIAARGSTDTQALGDPMLATALQFIHQRAHEGIRVDDVLRHVPLSRRVLESRFRKWLGRSPHEEIERVRMAQVMRLLRESDLSIDQIATRTGFPDSRYMATAFKRRTGQSPRSFRAASTGPNAEQRQ